MPELPEVETVRRGLAPAMEGAVIARAEVNRPDLRWPFPDRMAERLIGQRVAQLRRRSKYILADLSSGETLLIHLGMSGRMTVSGDPLGQFTHSHPMPEKHDHVVLHMDNGARITFNDPRRFGAMDLMPTATADTHKLLAVLGPEPLGNDFHEDHLIAAFKGRNTPVKSALLLAGLQIAGDSQIHEVVATRDHTEKLLAAFGADITVAPDPDSDSVDIRLVGLPELRPQSISVPGDPSAAAFAIAFGWGGRDWAARILESWRSTR